MVQARLRARSMQRRDRHRGIQAETGHSDVSTCAYFWSKTTSDILTEQAQCIMRREWSNDIVEQQRYQTSDQIR